MNSFRLKKTAVSSILLILIAVLLLPLSGAMAQDKWGEEGAGKGEAREAGPGNVYIARDVLERDPVTLDLMERAVENMPENMVPAAFRDEPADGTKRSSGELEKSGGGSGGWYPLNRAYTPSADPGVNYDFETGDYGNAIDQNGVQHSYFLVKTMTDVRQAPDPGPTAIIKPLSDIYYASYLNGTWSTPVNIAPTSGFEDCNLVMWELDDNNYLHFIYTRWTWGRDSTQPAAEPPVSGDYLHTNENLFYRYMAPDGTWSAPRQITNMPNGYWAIVGGSFTLYNNRIYGTAGARLDKLTGPPSFTERYMFAEGYLDDWAALHTLKEWDHTAVAGSETAFFPPAFDVSRVSGEVTTVFSTLLLGAGPLTSSCKVYGAAKSASGTWSPATALISGANNEAWRFFFVVYQNSSTVSTCLGTKSVFTVDATHEPNGNMVLLRHESSGWKPVINFTRTPSGQVTWWSSFSIDPMGLWHMVFASNHYSWDGANWINTGASLHYTKETASGLGEVQTIYAYTANRTVDWWSTSMDVNGGMHVVFPSFDIATGTDYKLYYSDNAGGSWMAPTQLSANDGQVIDDAILSVSPEGRTVATWLESKLSGAGVPEIGRLNSMTYQNGSWSSRKNISAVPGSADIVHTVGGWPTYADVEDGNQGDQVCIFETAKYNPGPGTYYDFKKYYCESMNGAWSAPELISNTNASGMGDVWLDRNNIARTGWYVDDPATSKNVLYCTTQKQPTPSASTYYFAEGTTRPGFQEWLSLQNAGAAEANVTITYMLGTGENKEQEVKVPAHSRVTVDVNGFVGPGQDVSASVVSDQIIVAERPMYFNYQGNVPGGHVAVGSTRTSRVLFFAEGTTRPGFNEYLTLQNPSDTNTEVTITYMFGDGTTRDQKVTVNKKTRQTVDVNAFVGADKDFSIKIVSPDIAIAAERPMYFNYHSILQGGHDAVGSASLDNRWYFAEGTTRPGFDTYLCLQNPGPVDATANVTYIMGDGSTTEVQVNLPATSRQTVNVRDIIGSDKDVSFVVDANTMILVERPMYFDYHGFAQGGHNVMGGHEPKNAWYLAEGTTRTGFDEWICLENAGGQDGAAVLSYMMGDGSLVNKDVPVPAHTRVTVDVRTAIGIDKDVSTYVWCDKGIIVERPMYYSNGDRRWNGGSCVMGF